MFQRASDAKIVDDPESRIAKMIRPLTLRYCNTLRSFCAGICFATDDVSTRGLVDTLLRRLAASAVLCSTVRASQVVSQMSGENQ